MLISDKQHQANRQNAQHSPGPTSPEGKAAVRFNALTWGLRARSLMLDDEDPADYQQLWDDLEAEWQPQTHTERYYLEQMSMSQWLLTRTAASETRIRQAGLHLGTELELLDRIAAQRTRLERSFTSGMRELKQLQKERQARRPQPAPGVRAAQPPVHPPAEPQVPRSDYKMADRPEANPVFCSPAAPDSR